MTTAVETFELCKQYKQNLAVDHISLRVPMGVKCGFLGKNGAGKTTTIKMLTGLKKPTSGSFSILGEPQTFGQRNAAIGYLPDVPNFYDYMTGEEFLDLCGRLYQIPPVERKQQVRALLAQVGLDRVKTRIATYSRGMKQRLGIAQAMMNRPSIIFMDEPISALDPTGRREVMDVVRNFKDTTVVFSTHILADVEDICDYILIIEKGKICAQDSLEALKAKHARNMVKIGLFEEAHLALLEQALAPIERLTVTRTSPLDLNVASETREPATISRALTAFLGKQGIPLRDYAVHTPTLEEIFHETIQSGGGKHV
ncbi:MAG: ABC transporter ATP-binding protein [Oscillospiraceae bacterium]|nr:ABC transporter ATP-binding protein [Oscillospiraceae bacterium]